MENKPCFKNMVLFSGRNEEVLTSVEIIDPITGEIQVKYHYKNIFQAAVPFLLSTIRDCITKKLANT